MFVFYSETELHIPGKAYCSNNVVIDRRNKAEIGEM
jgi:hypothetical protein